MSSSIRHSHIQKPYHPCSLCAASHAYSFTLTQWLLRAAIFPNLPSKHNHKFQNKKAISRLPPRQLGPEQPLFHHTLPPTLPQTFPKRDRPGQCQTKRSCLTCNNHSNSTVSRNSLMASNTLNSSLFSKNPFESVRSPPHPPKQASAPVPCAPRRSH